MSTVPQELVGKSQHLNSHNVALQEDVLFALALFKMENKKVKTNKNIFYF